MSIASSDPDSSSSSGRRLLAPNESEMVLWLEDLLSRPTGAKRANPPDLQGDGPSHTAPNDRRLTLVADIGPLKNELAPVIERIAAVEGLLAALHIEYAVHDVHYTNPLLISVEIEALRALAAEGGALATPVAVALVVSHAIRRLLPDVLAHRIAVREADILKDQHDTDNDIRRGQAEQDRRDQQAITDRVTAQTAAEWDRHLIDLHRAKDAAALEREVMRTTEYLVAALGNPDVDADEVFRRLRMLHALGITSTSPPARHNGDPSYMINLRDLAAGDSRAPQPTRSDGQAAASGSHHQPPSRPRPDQAGTG